MAVLDLACGHGRIANRLAARGCEVTGLDSSAVFLDRARADAAALGVSVDYVSGDMRELPWTGRFDRIRDGPVRRVPYHVRMFMFPELRDWLLAAGFTAVAGYGEDGKALKTEHDRMIVVATTDGATTR